MLLVWVSALKHYVWEMNVFYPTFFFNFYYVFTFFNVFIFFLNVFYIYAHRCVVPLVNCWVLYFSAWQRSTCPRHFLVSAEQATPHFISPDRIARRQPSGLHYLWHRLIACLSVLCAQNVKKLKQCLLDVWYDMLTFYCKFCIIFCYFLTFAFHRVV